MIVLTALYWICGFVSLASLTQQPPDALDPPELNSSSPVNESGDYQSDTGYYQLAWELDDDVEPPPTFTLQEAPTDRFARARAIYQGGDASTSISGRRNGEYHYRVRAGDGQWSDAVTVIVQHRSLTQALIFLALGAVVFLATVILIIAGHVTHRRNGVSA